MSALVSSTMNSLGEFQSERGLIIKPRLLHILRVPVTRRKITYELQVVLPERWFIPLHEEHVGAGAPYRANYESPEAAKKRMEARIMKAWKQQVTNEAQRDIAETKHAKKQLKLQRRLRKGKV